MDLERAWPFLLATVLVVAFTLGGVMAWVVIDARTTTAEYDVSQYRYEVTVATDARLTDASFRIPVPALKNESRIGTAVLGGIGERRAAWHYELAESGSGPMLGVKAPAIDPTGESGTGTGTGTETGTDGGEASGDTAVTLTLPAEEPVDTATPIGTEPILQPRSAEVGVACTTATGGATDCLAYDGRLYASYDAPPDANVTVRVRVVGENAWKSGDEWRRTAYVDFQRVTLTGPQDGWTTTEGRTWIGVGTGLDEGT